MSQIARGPKAVLIGHSLGARVALAASSPMTPALVLLASALGEPPFMAPRQVESWRRTGARLTRRPDPDSAGATVTLPIPSDFCDGLERFPSPQHIACPTLVVTMSDDRDLFPLPASITKPAHSTVTIDGPHRFWEEPAVAAQVKDTVASWLETAVRPTS